MNTERFENAYNALVDAFYKGTLAKFDCACCAVGNIVGAAMGKPITKEEFEDKMNLCKDGIHPWGIRKDIENMWMTACGDLEFTMTEHYTEFENAMQPCGYTGWELHKIERAFEGNTKIKIIAYPHVTEQEIIEDQYNGLCAVFDVLCELDNIPKEAKYSEKLKGKEGLVLTY